MNEPRTGWMSSASDGFEQRAPAASGLAALFGASLYADYHGYQGWWLAGYALVCVAAVVWLWERRAPTWVVVAQGLAAVTLFVIYKATDAPLAMVVVIVGMLQLALFEVPTGQPQQQPGAELSPTWTRDDAIGERADWQRGRWS